MLVNESDSNENSDSEQPEYNQRRPRPTLTFLPFLQRVSIACYAKRCTSYRKSVRLSIRLSVRLSVRHSLALCQNDSR